MGRDTKVNVSSVWKTLKKVSVNVSSVWKEVYKIYAKIGGVWEEVFIKPVTLIVSANVDGVNLFTAFSSPTLPAQFIYIINSGVIVGSTNSTIPAIAVPNSFPAGSEILIKNNGQIIGMGGAGGNGGTEDNNGITVGLPGGDSIDISRDVSIDNTNGDIFGGGGGGGGGGAESCADLWAGGGGGGGGAGDNGGAGGSGANSTGGFEIDGANGNAGTTVGGSGGVGGTILAAGAGDGGDGGEYGSAGNVGQNSQNIGTCTDYNGAGGGAAGKAVDLNSNLVTWLGGNNPTQVKGAVT